MRKPGTPHPDRQANPFASRSERCRFRPVDLSHRRRVKWENPNVIIILADDLVYGDLGGYGNKVLKTPTWTRSRFEYHEAVAEILNTKP